MKWPWGEPVLLVRVFLGTVGATSVVTGLMLSWLSLWRLNHPAPVPLPVPRFVATAFTVAFLFLGLLQGVAWMLVALSRRLWSNSTSS